MSAATPPTVPYRAPGLRPHRRDLRVRHPRRGRQGQGPQGRRASGDRLRRRRARLPDPRTTSSRPPSRPAATRSTTATPRPAGCPSSRPPSPRRRCATPATRSTPPRSWSPTAASRPSTRRSPRSSTRATRSSSRRRTGRPTRSRSGWPAVSRSRSSPTRPPATASPSSSWRRPAPSARRSCSSSPRPTRPARSTAASRRRGDRPLGRRARPVGAHRRDLRAPGLRRRRSSPRCPALVPELRDKCIVVNGVAKTYAMTGWRVGWIIGPKDVVKAATNLQSHATSNVSNVAQVAALAAVSGDLDAVAEMRDGLRPPPPDHRADAQRDRRRGLPGARGRVLRLPVGEGAARQGDPRQAPGRPRVELAALILDEAEVAVVPGEAFGTPGYLRLSYALGDEDLVEGVSPDPEAAGRGAGLTSAPVRAGLPAEPGPFARARSDHAVRTSSACEDHSFGESGYRDGPWRTAGSWNGACT